MSTSELVHDDTFCFNGTNYIMWRLRMLCHFRAMGPNALRIVVVGDSNLKDGHSPSLEDMHLDSEALSVIHQAITFEVFKSISTCSLAHEAWTKLEVTYGGSNLVGVNAIWEDVMEEFSIASTFDCLDASTSSTSSICDMSQGNDMEIKKNEEHLIDEHPSSPKESTSTPFTHMCLMARGNDEVSSSLSDNDDSFNEDDDDDLTQNLYEI